MNEENHNFDFSIEFTIPRDLELSKGFEVRNGDENFSIILSILDTKIKLPGINIKDTTATFENYEDRFGDNVETRLKAEFKLNKDIFNDNLEQGFEKRENWQELAKDWREGKRFNFCFRNILILLNQIIETHQYVNDKYYIFPIELRNIYNIQINYFGGGGLIINHFGGGFFTNDLLKHELRLNDYTNKILQFINNKEPFFEPLRIMKYSIEFMKMNLFRIAITEAQSAIEYLLEKKSYELNNPLEENLGFWKKLEEYSKLQVNFDFDKFTNKKDLSDANKLRNDIIHGRETPSLNKEICLRYIHVYRELFDMIYLGRLIF